MAIQIIHYIYQDEPQWGIVQNDTVLPIPGNFITTADFIQHNPVDKLLKFMHSGGSCLALADVKLLSPVTRHQQFLCLGANYRQHMIESGIDPDQKQFNLFFTKAPSCIVAANHPIEKPDFVKLLDYEVELGLVLKRSILKPTQVTSNNLHEYVAGLVIVNDVSARDIQIPQMQFYKGKSFRTFGPVGPYLCLLEPQDIPLIGHMKLTLSVNGQVRQSDSTANLVYSPEETLTEWSGVHNLWCGDLIATGTPAGCALKVPSPFKQRLAALLPEALRWKMFLKMQEQRSQYLKVGDQIRTTIVSECNTLDLGVQKNLVTAA